MYLQHSDPIQQWDTCHTAFKSLPKPHQYQYMYLHFQTLSQSTFPTVAHLKLTHGQIKQNNTIFSGHVWLTDPLLYLLPAGHPASNACKPVCLILFPLNLIALHPSVSRGFMVTLKIRRTNTFFTLCKIIEQKSPILVYINDTFSFLHIFLTSFE